MLSTTLIDLNQVVLPPGSSILLQDINWQKFEEILSALGELRSSQVAYDQGTLEIMVPLPEHKYFKVAIGDLVGDLADELDIEYESFGSSTWKREEIRKGVEPDDCFYFQSFEAIRGRVDIDLNQHPPPDLMLEIDITSKSLDRMPIYARLGVPEVWRYNKGQLKIYLLSEGRYIEAESSLAFSEFPVKQLPEFIKKIKLPVGYACEERFVLGLRVCTLDFLTYHSLTN